MRDMVIGIRPLCPSTPSTLGFEFQVQRASVEITDTAGKDSCRKSCIRGPSVTKPVCSAMRATTEENYQTQAVNFDGDKCHGENWPEVICCRNITHHRIFSLVLCTYSREIQQPRGV